MRSRVHEVSNGDECHGEPDYGWQLVIELTKGLRWSTPGVVAGRLSDACGVIGLSFVDGSARALFGFGEI